jgi:hypothetical protein
MDSKPLSLVTASILGQPPGALSSNYAKKQNQNNPVVLIKETIIP